jgi:2'-5' RNA ligase
VRCFISVDIEEQRLLKAILESQRLLEMTGAKLKCVGRENIHITIRFLGEVRDIKVGEIKRIISGIAFEPFHIKLRGLGVFPRPSRPRVIWVGISEGVKELSRIYQLLESELLETGFKPEVRGFSPHITIARVRSGRNIDRLMEVVMADADKIYGGIEVKHIRLKKSVLTPRGAIYSTIAESRGKG